jgi:hypothetical protein
MRAGIPSALGDDSSEVERVRTVKEGSFDHECSFDHLDLQSSILHISIPNCVHKQLYALRIYVQISRS